MGNHDFSRGVTDSSIVPEKDIDHYDTRLEGGPEDLLEERPFPLVFLLTFILKGERLTTRKVSMAISKRAGGD